MSSKKELIKISLTDFMNFMAAHVNKSSIVNGIVTRQKKRFYSGYYLPLTEGIIAYHQQNRNSTFLQNALSRLHTDSKNYENQYALYKNCIQTYLALDAAQTKTCIWVDPPTGHFLYENLSITLKPELGLLYKRKGDKVIKNHIIKIHFKEDPLTKQNANAGIALLEQALGTTSDIPTEYCILDLRRGHLFRRDRRIKNPMFVVQGEAESFLKIWELTTAA